MNSNSNEQVYSNAASFEASSGSLSDNGTVNENMVENNKYQRKSVKSFFKSIATGLSNGVKHFSSSVKFLANNNSTVEANKEELQEVSENDFEETMLVDDDSVHSVDVIEEDTQKNEDDDMEVIVSDDGESIPFPSDTPTAYVAEDFEDIEILSSILEDPQVIQQEDTSVLLSTPLHSIPNQEEPSDDQNDSSLHQSRNIPPNAYWYMWYYHSSELTHEVIQEIISNSSFLLTQNHFDLLKYISFKTISNCCTEMRCPTNAGEVIFHRIRTCLLSYNRIKGVFTSIPSNDLNERMEGEISYKDRELSIHHISQVKPKMATDSIPFWLKGILDKIDNSVPSVPIVSSTPVSSSKETSDFSSNAQPLSSTMPTRINNKCLDSFYWDSTSVKWICLVIVNQRLSPKNSLQRFFNHFSYPEAVHVVMLSRHSLLAFPKNNDVNIKDVLTCLKESFTVKAELLTVEDSMEIEVFSVKYPFSLKERSQSQLLSYFSQILTTVINCTCLEEAVEKLHRLHHSQTCTQPIKNLKIDKNKEPKEGKNARFIHLSFTSEVTRKQITMVVDKLLLEKVYNLKTKDEVEAFKKQRGTYLRVTRLCTYTHPFAFRINISNSNMKKFCSVLQQEIPQIFKDNKCLIRIISHYNPENGRVLGAPNKQFSGLISVASLNCGTMKDRVELMSELMNSNHIDYLALQETKSTSSSPPIYLPPYRIAENGPETDMEGFHGVAVFSRSQYSIREAKDSTPNLVLQFIRQSGNRPFYFGSVYIPHKKTPAEVRKKCIEKISYALLKLVEKSPTIPIIIGGDFNTSPGEFERVFRLLLQKFQFATINDYTFCRGSKKSTIDYFLWYGPNMIRPNQIEARRVQPFDHRLLVTTFQDLRPSNYNLFEDPRPNINKILSEMMGLANEECFTMDFILDMTRYDESLFNSQLEAAMASFEQILEGRMKDKGMIERKKGSIHFSGHSDLHERNREIRSIPAVQRTEEQKRELNSNLTKIRHSQRSSQWNFLNKICIDMRTRDSRSFFQLVRHTVFQESISKPVGIRAKETDSEVTTDPIECQKIITEHLKSMYQKLDVTWELPQSTHYQFKGESLDYPITMSELREAVMKTGRVACGIDGIPNEFLKALIRNSSKSTLMNACLTFCNLIFEGHCTRRINTSVITMIPKKKDSTLLSDFRPIAVATTFSKIVASVINTRLLRQVVKDEVISPEQSGFLPGQEYTGQALALMSRMEEMEREGGGFVAFLDIHGAYNAVVPDILIHRLRLMNCSPGILQYIQSIYKNSSVVVKWETISKEHIPLERGLRQGDPLSPTLFLLYINDVPRYNGADSNILLYADDIAIYDRTLEGLQYRLTRIGEELLGLALDINPAKCGVMGTNSHYQQLAMKATITCQNKQIYAVEKYKYLGFPLSVGCSRKEIGDKMFASAEGTLKSLQHFLVNRMYPLSPKINLAKAIILPALSYGLEMFGLEKRQITIRERLEYTLLRMLLGSRVNASKRLLYMEFNIVPIRIVNIQKQLRVFAGTHCLSKSLEGIITEARETKKYPPFFKAVARNYPHWMYAKMVVEFLNLSRVHPVNKGVITAYETKYFGNVLDPLTDVQVFVNACKNLFQGQDRYDFLNITPELLEEVIDANLILYILPGPTLLELGLPQRFLSQFGHPKNAIDSSMESYIRNGMYKQQQYKMAWHSYPENSFGFRVIGWLRAGIYKTQDKLGYKVNDDASCVFCKQASIETDIHMVDECPRWEAQRHSTIQRIRQLIPSLPEDVKLSSFFMGNVKGQPMYASRMNWSTRNKKRFQKIIDCFEMWYHTRPRVVYPEGEEESEMDLSNGTTMTVVTGLVAQYLGSIDWNRKGTEPQIRNRKRRRDIAVDTVLITATAPREKSARHSSDVSSITDSASSTSVSVMDITSSPDNSSDGFPVVLTNAPLSQANTESSTHHMPSPSRASRSDTSSGRAITSSSSLPNTRILPTKARIIDTAKVQLLLKQCVSGNERPTRQRRDDMEKSRQSLSHELELCPEVISYPSPLELVYPRNNSGSDWIYPSAMASGPSRSDDPIDKYIMENYTSWTLRYSSNQPACSPPSPWLSFLNRTPSITDLKEPKSIEHYIWKTLICVVARIANTQFVESSLKTDCSKHLSFLKSSRYQSKERITFLHKMYSLLFEYAGTGLLVT